MAKRHSSIPLVALLVSHARWSCVWAWLDNLARPHPHIQRGFGNFLKEVDVAAIFADIDLTAPLSPAQVEALLQRWFYSIPDQKLSFSEGAFKTWMRWFGGGREGQGKRALSPAKRLSPLRSLHEARVFYGDANPDNLQRRFVRIFTDEKYRRSTAPRADGPPENMLEWGAQALTIVRQHGGWNKFIQLSWHEIKDLPYSPHKLASDPDSFIQRILHLGRDRYVQILAPAVAPLWPLFVLRFFVKQQRRTQHWDETFESVRELSQLSLKADQFDLEKLTASEASNPDRLFIDIHVRRGHLHKLPFPFGAAERAVQQDAADNGVWEPQLLVKVRERLFEDGLPWSPPLLLCMRGDVLADPDADMNKKLAVRCLTLSTPCHHYATAFAGEHLSFETVVGQDASWAEVPGENFGNAFERVSREAFWKRAAGFKPAKSKELFLGYFPLDLPLRAKLIPLSRSQIYDLSFRGKRLSEEVADNIAYVLPGAVLAGASSLGAQPRMPALLKDLGGLLWRLELFCRNLAARPDEVSALRKDLNNPLNRHESAAVLAKECAKRAAERLDRYFRSVRKEHESLLPKLMVRACNEMAEALDLTDCERENFEGLMEAWGWAVLLEFLPFTSIGYGGEMVFRD